MIFKRRSATLLVLLFGAFVANVSSDDFKFDHDDFQVVNSDPSNTATNPTSRYIYAKEVAQCPTGESKTMLTLLLQSLRWNEISERKKEKAIKKLSRFFLVPRQFITVSDIHAPEILEMLKHSLNKSNNLLNTKESVARFEFMIGCGDKLFPNGKTIALHINEYMKFGALDELTGLPFTWWNIWSKHVKSRVQRTRREAADGSGSEEADYDDEEFIYDDDEEEEGESPVVATEAPRTRHNLRKNKKRIKKIYVARAQDEPSADLKDGSITQIITEKVDDAPSVPLDLPQSEISDIEVITQHSATLDGRITPIDVIENIKLESYVNKTIVNDNNVVDVPLYDEKDKMLDEVRKMISEPPTELATVTLTTTTESVKIAETTTISEPITTLYEEPTTIMITTTPAPETETIFIPSNNENNQNINVYDEKVSIFTTESPRLDEVTEKILETTQTSTTTIPPTTEIITHTEPTITTSTLKLVETTVATTDKVPSGVEIEPKKESQPRTKNERRKPDEESESNYDDEYDDTLPEEGVSEKDDNDSAPSSAATEPTTTKATRRTTFVEVTTSPSITEQETSPPTQPTTAAQTEAATEQPIVSVTTESPSESGDYEDANVPPRVEKRIPKTAVTAGKPFVIKVEENVFYDVEDKNNLTLELLDKDKAPISSTSWIRFNSAKREIYGLPLESDVSRYEFKLRATDSAGDSVEENVDITVQQHKSYRSANHEIYIQVKLEKNYESPVDWEIRLVRGIVEALDDGSTGSVVVREVRPNKYESNMFTFVFTNDSLPKDHCPKDELDELMTKLTKPALNEAMKREIIVRNVEKDLIGSCQERTPTKVHVPKNEQNFPPTVRNPVDQVAAYVGQLLVYEVPKDTFYDPEDQTELKLSLLNGDRSKLDPNHWLQFDAKNREFYGVPGPHEKSQQYILVAEDKNGLTTNDALIIEVKMGTYKRDHGAAFEYQLDIGHDQFNTASTKRKFIEGIARVFQDSDTSQILFKMAKKLQYAGRTSVVLQNRTLYRENRECPTAEIEKLRNILLRQDRSVRDEVKETIGNDFNVLKITVAPTGSCAGDDSYHHQEEITARPDDQETPIINQDVLITYVLPTAIILVMLLIALLIACILYKRRNTGKMELGDEEERKSFRSKGIPVIFQDELEEKPEILTKSPVILKDEKPPLLPQYNGLNQDDEDNMDQYIPPQPLMMGSRESRGKSPVTPSYRKPPPYVSP